MPYTLLWISTILNLNFLKMIVLLSNGKWVELFLSANGMISLTETLGFK